MAVGRVHHGGGVYEVSVAKKSKCLINGGKRTDLTVPESNHYVACISSRSKNDFKTGLYIVFFFTSLTCKQIAESDALGKPFFCKKKNKKQKTKKKTTTYVRHFSQNRQIIL